MPIVSLALAGGLVLPSLLVIAVEVLQVTLSVLIGLFILRVLERLLLDRNPASRLGAALDFVIG